MLTSVRQPCYAAGRFRCQFWLDQLLHRSRPATRPFQRQRPVGRLPHRPASFGEYPSVVAIDYVASNEPRQRSPRAC